VNRLLLLALACLPACTLGVVPRDAPPPEPAPAAEPAALAAEPTPPAAGPTPPAAEARVEYRLDGNRLELPGPIVFTAGKAQLAPASDPALEHARGYLAAKESVTVLRIEAHADDQALSEQQALAVGRWLVAHGVDCKRLLAVGFGASKPVADASTPEGKARNTRIELHNAALRGRPIGGASLEGGGQVASADLCQ
jgi:OOP family OmpA-OmpF porin